MSPAPYKVSMPQNAERVKAIDGAALRKESWILGQCPDTYNTSNRNSFRSPSIDPTLRGKNAQAVRELKQKVAGTSIKNESPSNAFDGSMYKTNSAIVHRDLGKMEVVDQSARDAQRKKLT